MLGIDEADPDMSDREFEALAAKVDEYLQVITDRFAADHAERLMASGRPISSVIDS